MKYIRELRMGAPKTWKTGAIVGSYPKPLLYFGFDVGGIDIIPETRLNGYDCTHADIEFLKPGQLKLEAPKKPITCLDYTTALPHSLVLGTVPNPSQDGMKALFEDYNKLANKTDLPWKTIVFDSVTGLMDMGLNWLSSYNANMLADARQWAYQVGQKVKQVILSSTCLPANVIIIMHTSVEKDELTQQIRELPSVYSGLRNDIGGLFSQVFYAAKSNGKPVIWTNDKGFVKGIGSRWPANLPTECGPTYKEIYETNYPPKP